ncbi:ABC transporter permease [Variovorax robiniae]|uniref:ABC transporter permease n=1 Tax=Variovorax robiniae TaxID=1836199 RepID=A0ABU8XG82_9BURK
MKRSPFAQFTGPLVALLLICIVVAVTTPSFLAADNFRNIALQVAVLSVVAIGSTIVILTGGIDLSPGSMIAYLTMVLAVMVKLNGTSLWLAIPAAIALGGLLGVVNGLLVAYVRIPAFIVTLAGLSAFKGIALTVGGGTPVFSLSPDLGQVFYGELLGIPLPFYYVLGLYALATVVLNHSKFGREIYAVGGNESAARLSGIHVPRVRAMAFVIAGACAGIGAVLLAARLNSGSPNYGTLIELQAIAAAVVGGASLAGGRGHVLNTLVGVLIIVVVQNGLNLNAVSTSVQSITIGLIILLAVGVDIWRERITAVFVERFGKRQSITRQEVTQ